MDSDNVSCHFDVPAPDVSPMTRGLYLCFFILGLIFEAACWYAWMVTSGKYDYLRVRSHGAMVFICLGFFCAIMSVGLYGWSLDQDRLLNSCELHSFLLVCAAFFFMAGILRQYLTFHMKHLLLHKVIDLFKDGYIGSINGSGTRSAPGYRARHMAPSAVLDKFNDIIRQYRRLCSPQFKLKLFLIFFFATNVSAIVVMITLCPRFGIVKMCSLRLHYKHWVRFMVIFYGLSILFTGYIAFKSRSFPDPFHILREIKFFIVNSTILLFVLLIQYKITKDTLTEDNHIEYALRQFWSIFIFFVAQFIHMMPWQIYKASTTNCSLNMIDIMNNELGMKLFTQHLHKEISYYNLNFLNEVDKWKNTFKKAPERRNVAHNIFKTYISEGNIGQVNISHFNREQVKKVFEHGIPTTIDEHVFDDAAREVFMLMEEDSFGRFKTGGLYDFYIGLDDPLDHIQLLRYS